MARPRKEAAEKLTSRLPHIRCSERDLSRIQSKADQAGLSLSAYVRRMALDGEIIVRQARTDFELSHQLKRIGVNLNQQTAKFHATGQAPKGLDSLWSKLETVLDQMLDGATRR